MHLCRVRHVPSKLAGLWARCYVWPVQSGLCQTGIFRARANANYNNIIIIITAQILEKVLKKTVKEKGWYIKVLSL